MNRTENISGRNHTSAIFTLFGVKVNNITSQTALAVCRRMLQAPDHHAPGRIYFANVHSYSIARVDESFRECLRAADLVLPDGSGLKLAGRIFRTPIIENLNGTDFIPKLLHEAAMEGCTIYLLGARKNVVTECARRVQQRYPSIRIAGFHDGHSIDRDTPEIIAELRTVKPDILLVALGSPLQEKWIVDNCSALDIKICLAVGGLFDFLSGARKRAPLWMRRSGIEWIFRCIQEPSDKWKRVVIEIPTFLAFVLLHRLNVLATVPSEYISGDPA